jgi:hypothetical protein
MPACSFLPAPPGNTPSCAGPGKTYCEHAPYYPTNVIKHLIHKWDYDFSSLLADETGDEFNSVGYRNPVTISQFYGPPQTSYTQPSTQQHYSPTEGYNYDPPSQKHYTHKKNNYNNAGIYNEEYAEPIYIPTPNNYNNQVNGGITTNYQTQTSLGNEYQKKLLHDYNYYYSPPRATYYNQADNFKRYLRDIKAQNSSQSPLMMKRKKRSIVVNQTNKRNDFVQNFLDQITNDDVKTRTKRQSAGRTALCQTRSSFIQPQAALSSKDPVYVLIYVNYRMATIRDVNKSMFKSDWLR